MKNTKHCVLWLFAWTLMPSLLVAQEWSRFRGPNGTGASESSTIPVKWTDKDINWSTQLPGIGHSSPIGWGNKLFVLSADPKTATRHVLCVDSETGDILWQRDYKSLPHHLHARSSFASSTPGADSQRVYVAWSVPNKTTLRALDHSGAEVWTKDLGTWTSQHGYGASPIIYKNLLILHNSQQARGLKPHQLESGQKPGRSYMFAFDAQTGDEVWRKELKSMNVCYSVPFIFSPPQGGPDELVCTSTSNGIFSLNPLTGEENWSIDVFKMLTVNSPITAGGLIFGTNGSGAYSGNFLVAVRGGRQPEIAFQLKNSGKFKAPYVPSLISYGDLVFCIYDRGFASCIDAKTGKIHWFERTNAAFNGSPVRVRDKIYIADEDGIVWVFAASQKYQGIAKNPLGNPSRSTPAVLNGQICFRTYSESKPVSQLVSIGQKKP